MICGYVRLIDISSESVESLLLGVEHVGLVNF